MARSASQFQVVLWALTAAGNHQKPGGCWITSQLQAMCLQVPWMDILIASFVLSADRCMLKVYCNIPYVAIRWFMASTKKQYAWHLTHPLTNFTDLEYPRWSKWRQTFSEGETWCQLHAKNLKDLLNLSTNVPRYLPKGDLANLRGLAVDMKRSYLDQLPDLPNVLGLSLCQIVCQVSAWLPSWSFPGKESASCHLWSWKCAANATRKHSSKWMAKD